MAVIDPISNMAGVDHSDQLIYFQIRQYLRFINPRKDVNCQDKLHKIWYILDTVRQSFKDEYVPHKEVTVDEAMVLFKGRLGFK